MRAVLFEEPGSIVVREVDEPPLLQIMGHEIAGIVEATGPGCRPFRPGGSAQFVAIRAEAMTRGIIHPIPSGVVLKVVVDPWRVP